MPEHPFVACCIDGVPVNALLDTGSMKSFISDRIHNIFDFDGGRLDTSQSHRCTSITGGALNIAGTISTIVTFSRSKHNYHSSFLVSSNIPYDCVLGWDFITQRKLSIRGDFLGGRSHYQLVGTYGKNPIHAEHPAMNVESNGVVMTEANSPVVSPSEASKSNAVLVQSQLKGVSKVIVHEVVAIPARSEMVTEGKIQAKYISQVGMISVSQADSIRRLQGIHVAHLVVTPAGKTVPVRIANTTSNEIELPKGCKLAEFCPLIEQEAVANTKFPVNAVENYIRQCDICAKRKAPAPTANNGTAPLQSLQVSEPFTFWALDYMGPLPETHRGNKHILAKGIHGRKNTC